MYLDYSKIAFDSTGRVEQPELMLQTKGGRRYGTIPGVSALKINIKLSEPSEISFSVASKLQDGSANPMYDLVVGHRIIYTSAYGVYVLAEPEEDQDGLYASKTVKGYSIEKELDNKKFFLEEGTFNFYDPINPGDSIIGRILELAPDWNISVARSLWGRYRTFDEFNGNLLTIMYGDISEKFRCVFVFDPYGTQENPGKTIHVYDADEERRTLPIYLDFDNLVDELKIKELTGELVTALRPTGSDDLNIIDVNPTGSMWVYDLSYFVENGDITGDLADKYAAWQRAVAGAREQYKAITALRSSSTANKLMKEAELVRLNDELADLINQQSVAVQQQASEITSDGYAYQQTVLNSIRDSIVAKRGEIADKQDEISTLENMIAAYKSGIDEITGSLSFENYFDQNEQRELMTYCVEDDLSDDTFVATGFLQTQDGIELSVAGGSIALSDAVIHKTDMPEFDKTIYTVTGGTFSISNDDDSKTLSGDTIRGTLEIGEDNSFVFSVFTGAMKSGGVDAESGTIVVNGTVGDIDSDVKALVTDGVTEYVGSKIDLMASSGSAYVTFNVSDFQRYSVASELYDYAVEVLNDKAVPTYEFSVESGNFLFAQEFAPFRDALELGCCINLRIGENEVITPIAIEIELDFDNEDDFSILFSNRFKRHDNVNTLKDVINQSYSSSRAFNANKYLYNQTAKQTDAVTDFLRSAQDAAVRAILGARDQNVVYDKTGIRISSLSDAAHQVELRLTNGMIAMSDDDWATAKLAIGYFQPVQGLYSDRDDSDDKKLSPFFGVNAEVLGGRIVLTNNLILENPKLDENGNYTGVMQFRADSTGVWLNNSTFVLQSDDGGKLVIDPKYGLLAGTSGLFTTNGDSVTPAFICDDGSVKLEPDGMPKNTNFYIDSRNGSAYFRGTVYANAGKFAGELVAASGTFKGTVQASKFLDAAGNDMMDNSKWKSDYLSLTGLEIKDSSGSTVMKFNANGVTMYGGAITWGSDIAAGNISGLASVATSGDFDDLADIPKYIKGTYIDFNQVSSPHISGNDIGLYGGRFTVYNNSGQQKHGFIGHATGAATETITNGIAMSAGNIAENISFKTDGNYIIATTEGVRLHSSKNGSGVNLYLTPAGAYVDDGDTTIKLGNSVAVFG